MKINAEKFGLLTKLIYNLFFRKKLAKAVKNSENKIDDAALKLIDSVAAGE